MPKPLRTTRLLTKMQLIAWWFCSRFSDWSDIEYVPDVLTSSPVGWPEGCRKVGCAELEGALGVLA